MTKEQSDSCPSVPALNRASRAMAVERLSFVVGADNDLCHPSLVGDWGPLPKEGRVFDPLFHNVVRAPLLTNSVQSPELRLLSW